MSCNICVENYNRSNRSIIKCDFCEFESCKECNKRYILNTMEDAHCMSCKKKWDRKIMFDKFEKVFVNKTYKIYREEILFDREKGLLPITQPYVERELKVEEIDRDILALRSDIQELYGKLEKLQNKKNELLNNKHSDVERKQFIRPCSNGDCKGFLSTQWKCGICSKYTCKDCLEVIINDDEHKCDPNNVETTKLILKDTKNCPQCGTSIFKIEGCDQMFCTQCHTAFSWKTGRIETGVIHNPHYFQWLNNNRREIPRNPNDMRCGRVIDHYFYNSLRRRSRDFCFIRGIADKIRNFIHLREIVLPTFRVDRINDNLQLRISYMRDKITEENFKRTLQKREKDIQKKTELYQILQVFVDCMTELLYRYEEHVSNTLRDNEEIKNEMNALREYVNTTMENISKVYNSKQYFINDTWEFL